ncbi:molybdopterin cofactor-binding domain-containing protein [Pelomicrobium sp. G1]|uniref:molybdopterin cofactor-binding domain-containing protein n=1 Tax=unclassified Pelomicrobium TaxID=2815318 RepID=UPI003F76A5DF
MIELAVNGERRSLTLDSRTPLLWALRDALGLKGTKYGCGVGVCGICVVWLDGAPAKACQVPLAEAAGRAVTTLEGLGSEHPVVRAWIAEQVPQCGYCQGGQIMTAAALLARDPRPSPQEAAAALDEVLCRCGTYHRIRRAFARAAQGDLPPAPGMTPPPAPPGTRHFALNDFVRLGTDGTFTVVVNHSEMGQGALTGLALLVAEELGVAPSALRTEFAPAEARYKNPMWNVQLTGGSSSIRGEWERLRRAGAEAREKLLAAAAKRWRVNARECRLYDDGITHEPTGRSLPLGELAEAAAQERPPARIRLKPPSAFRFIGRPAPRLDIPDMVAGRTVYGIDVEVPGRLVAVVARPPEFGGRLKRVDPSRALAVPGVVRVLEIGNGVAVVAETFLQALQGREALDIEWAPGPHGALSNDGIEAALEEALARPGKVVLARGRPKRVLTRAERVLEAIYATPYLAHGTLEPMNCTAHVHGDGCDVWVGTQSQEDAQKAAAQAAGLPRSRVRVHTAFLGGGFGRRLETDFVAEAVELSKAMGTPVQVLWTRADDLRHDAYRPAHRARLQAALDRKGWPEALFVRVAGPELALDMVEVPYAIPHYREEHAEVASPVPTGAWRAVGASQNGFVVEGFIDELAHAGGHDPFEFRRTLLASHPRHRAVLERAAALAGWGTPLPPGRGRGIATYASFGAWVALVAEAAVNEAGKIQVERVTSVIDCGLAVNPDSVLAQVEGGIAMGLSATLKEEVRIEGGRVTQATFRDYPILTFSEMPELEVEIAESREPPGGVGEPAVPVVAPAVANAVFAATGLRLRRLPLRLPGGRPFAPGGFNPMKCA